MTDVRHELPSTGALLTTHLPLDVRIAALAARQGGVVSTKQLYALGLSSSGVAHRVARGLLHRVHRGVYAVGHPTINGIALDHAALLACADGAVRSHRSAGVALQLRSWASRTVEVTAGSGRTRPGIIVHRRRLHPDDVTLLEGLATTTVARTIFDLAEVLTREQHLRAWQEGERLQLIDVRAVRAVAERLARPARQQLGARLRDRSCCAALLTRA